MPSKIKEFISLPHDKRTLTQHKPFNIDIKVRSEYGYWTWIGNNITHGDTLAYTFEKEILDISQPFFTAPLWNREFSNKVIYIKSDSYREWLKDLENNNVTYVLIKKNSREDRWIAVALKSPGWLGIHERFKVVYADENYKILGVLLPHE
jgi:hypothetical protein